MEPGVVALDRTGEVIGGRYHLRRKIGAGGMGAVYEATDTHGTSRALKLVEPLPGPKGRENALRFAREIRALQAVSHPNVVTIVEADAESERPWLVTELLSGEDLDALLRRVGRLSPGTAVQIALQIARGLAAVHARRHLHRDVKPSNVFLHRSGDGSIVVKLLDFGVAKVLFAENDSLTDTGLPLGTPLYMAPEQFKDAKHVDARVDVYAVGMALYRMLSGIAPFDGCASIQELAVRVTTETPAPLQQHAPWVPPGLARVVHGALLRDAAVRCPSVEALASRLSDFAQPTLAEGDLVAPEPETEREPAPPAVLPSRWSEIEGDPVEGLSPSSDHAVARALLGKTLGGRYRLLALIGAGGMGAVFKADAPGGAEVAVKVVTGAWAHRPEAAERFLREGRAAMKLRVAHVVHVQEVDVDTETKAPFMVMELLSGLNLGQVIRDIGPLAPDVAARIFLQVCEGLAEAHRLGLVHRDVKPTNIFLHNPGDGSLIAKLCDFGLVKETTADASDLTRTGGVLGTLAYMSPEQLADAKAVDARTDLWSVGASLFEALTGERLWREKTTIPELVTAISTQDPKPVQSLPGRIDADLARVVERTLQKKPEDRIGSARELVAALTPPASTAPRLTPEMLVPLSDERRARADRPATPWVRRVALGVVGLSILGGVAAALAASRGTPPRAAAEPPSSAIVVSRAPVTTDPAEAPSPTPATPAAMPLPEAPTAVASSEPARPARPALPPSPAPASSPSGRGAKRAVSSLATGSAAPSAAAPSAVPPPAPASAAPSASVWTAGPTDVFSK